MVSQVSQYQNRACYPLNPQGAVDWNLFAWRTAAPDYSQTLTGGRMYHVYRVIECTSGEDFESYKHIGGFGMTLAAAQAYIKGKIEGGEVCGWAVFDEEGQLTLKYMPVQPVGVACQTHTSTLPSIGTN
jgi:hypothetical protein